MKRHIITFSALLCVAIFSLATQAVAQTVEPHLNSRTPSVSRMDTRPLTLPFSSKEQAVEALETVDIDTVRSSYTLNLNGEWTIRQLPLDTPVAHIEAVARTASTRATAVPQKTKYSDALMVYSRNMRVPFSWIGRSVVLRLGRVSGGCYVYVNGQQVGYSGDSGIAAEFDVTQYVNEGANELMLAVYSEHVGSALEGYSSAAASIEGDVTLLSQPRFRIQDVYTQTYCDELTGDGVVLLNVVMKTDLLNSRTMRVLYEIADTTGRVVASDSRNITLEMREQGSLEFYARVKDAKMWSSESPNLYTLTVRTFFEGRYPEYISSDLGFRKVEIGENGLMINNRKVAMRTIQYDHSGKSITEVEEDIKKLRSLEVNTIIVANNAPQDWFFRLCDRHGMYVFTRANIAATAMGTSRIVGGAPANDPAWLDAYLERSNDAFLGAHRYASAIGIILGEGGGNGYSLYESYLAVKARSKDRPVVCLQAGGEWNTDMTSAEISSGGRDRLLIGESDHWQRFPRTMFVVGYNGSGVLEIENRNDFANLSDFDVNYKVMVRKRVSDSGSLELDLAPGMSADITLPVKNFPKKYNLYVDIVRRRSGDEVYANRF